LDCSVRDCRLVDSCDAGRLGRQARQVQGGQPAADQGRGDDVDEAGHQVGGGARDLPGVAGGAALSRASTDFWSAASESARTSGEGAAGADAGGGRGGARPGDGVLDGGGVPVRLLGRELPVVRLQHGGQQFGGRLQRAAEVAEALGLGEECLGVGDGCLGDRGGALPGRVAADGHGGGPGDTEQEEGAERGGRESPCGQTHGGSFRCASDLEPTVEAPTAL
jgi:hypothetical protein